MKLYYYDKDINVINCYYQALLQYSIVQCIILTTFENMRFNTRASERLRNTPSCLKF